MQGISLEKPAKRRNGFFTRNSRLLRLVLHLLLGVAKIVLLFPFAGQVRRAELVRAWSVRVLAILDVDLVVKGHVPDASARGVLFVSNHISWLDIYLLQAVRPVRFVSKAEVRSWPLIGWLAEKTGTIFVERTRRHDTARTNKAVIDALNQGDCVALFPEGTTSNGTLLRPFHSSLLQPAVATEALLWPVTIRYVQPDGAANLAPAYVDDISFADSLQRVLSEPGLVAEITYLEPLRAQGRSRRELVALAESAISSALNLAAPGRKPGKPAGPPGARP